MRYTRLEIVENTQPRDTSWRQSPVDELTDRWASGGSAFVLVTRKAWRPPTDVYETPSDVVVKMEIAGLKDSGISIVIADDVLSISGRPHDEAPGRKIGYHQMGISYGEFGVDIKLPGPVSSDEIVAEYEAGFLRVTLPKALPRESKPVRIPVTDSSVTR